VISGRYLPVTYPTHVLLVLPGQYTPCGSPLPHRWFILPYRPCSPSAFDLPLPGRFRTMRHSTALSVLVWPLQRTYAHTHRAHAPANTHSTCLVLGGRILVLHHTQDLQRFSPPHFAGRFITHTHTGSTSTSSALTGYRLFTLLTRLTYLPDHAVPG